MVPHFVGNQYALSQADYFFAEELQHVGDTCTK
jgi:hypothetical protein